MAAAKALESRLSARVPNLNTQSSKFQDSPPSTSFSCRASLRTDRPALAPPSQTSSGNRISTPRKLGSGSSSVNKGVIRAASAKHASSTQGKERAEDVLDADYVSPVIEAVRRAGQLIENSPAVVVGKSYCPFTRRVRELFKDLGARAEYIMLDEEENGDAIQIALAEMTGQPTVPYVFIGGEFIGGSDDTLALHSAGRLVPMLEAANAL